MAGTKSGQGTHELHDLRSFVVLLFPVVVMLICSIHLYGLVQEKRNSSASAMGLRLACTKPSICTQKIYCEK